MTTTNANPILVEGDIGSTAENAADALSALACLDFERLGNRHGAEFGLFLLLDTIADALNAASPRDRRASVNTDAFSEEARRQLFDLADGATLNDALEAAIQEAHQRAAGVAKEGTA